jgi:hypothetical protein
MERIDVVRCIPAPAARIVGLLWDPVELQRAWDPISEVVVSYCDGRNQEFTMRVRRDGRSESVRTIRFRRGRTITFFTPLAPPMMTWHRGAWLVDPAPGTDSGMSVVTAVREYELREDHPVAGEPAVFRAAFLARLGRILDRCADHLGVPGTPGTRGAGDEK